jgi:hypothetical protein
MPVVVVVFVAVFVFAGTPLLSLSEELEYDRDPGYVRTVQQVSLGQDGCDPMRRLLVQYAPHLPRPRQSTRHTGGGVKAEFIIAGLLLSVINLLIE